jgi:hypothetical protein
LLTEGKYANPANTRKWEKAELKARRLEDAADPSKPDIRA